MAEGRGVCLVVAGEGSGGAKRRGGNEGGRGESGRGG